MKLRQVLIWLFILAAAALTYYLTGEAERKAQVAKETSQRLLSLDDPFSIKRIELKGSALAKPVLIERRDQEHAWQMLSPLDCKADSLTVGRLISSVLDARVNRRLSGVKDPASFGLDPPRIRLSLTDRQGKKSLLLFGDKTPDGQKLYLQPANPKDPGEVWIVPAGLENILLQDTFTLRDKAVLDFVSADVSSLDLEKGAKSLRLLREKSGADARWSLGDGQEASPQEVEGLINRTHALRARSFIDRDFDPAKLGLDQPWLKLDLGLAAGDKKNAASKPMGILVGGKAEEPHLRYVRRLSGGPVMLVEQNALAGLAPSRHQLLERRPWRLKRGDIMALTIKRQGKELAFAKTDEGWVRTKPPGDKKSGEAAALFLWDLVDLKWEKILPPKGAYGLDPAQVGIIITLSDAAAQKEGKNTSSARTLYIGKLDPASGLLAAKLDNANIIYGLDKSFLDKIPKD